MSLLWSEEKVSFKFPGPTSTEDFSLLSNVCTDDFVELAPANISSTIKIKNFCW